MHVILIRGGGDLASGVALRLYRVGLNVVITEIAQPLAVRRAAAFAEAIYAGQISIEGVIARAIPDAGDTLKILNVLSKRQIPVLVDAECRSAQTLNPLAIVDGRMLKRAPEPLSHRAALYLGLGPGFTAPHNCHAVIETQRGHTLGRVIWEGSALPDSGLPEGDPRRVLRAPADGVLTARAQIGDSLEAGQIVAMIDERHPVLSPIRGVLRGLLHPGLQVTQGMKIGDVDGREDPRYCFTVSDKALAVGGGVLEALLTRPEVRSRLWA